MPSGHNNSCMLHIGKGDLRSISVAEDLEFLLDWPQSSCKDSLGSCRCCEQVHVESSDASVVLVLEGMLAEEEHLDRRSDLQLVGQPQED